MRRLVVAVAFAGVLAAARVAPAAETTMFRGDPAHTGVYQTKGPVAMPAIKWRLKTGGPVVSSPAVADGLLYLGSGDGWLYAIEAAGGKMQWRFPTGGAVDSSPAVSQGRVFFTSRDASCYALDARTGELRWRFRTDGERRFAVPGLFGLKPETQVMEDPWDVYLSSPAVAAGRVYFGSSDGSVYAVEAATGKLVWRFRTNGLVHSSPAVADGVVYVGSWDASLYALDARTGAERWRFKTGDTEGSVFTGIQSSPAVAGGVVYFGCRDANLYAVEARTGKRRWVFPIEGRSWVVSTPAVRDGRVFFGTSDSHRFFALDARTGEKTLELNLGMFVFSSPAIAGSTAYIGSYNGRLYAIDLTASKVAWFFPTASSARNAGGLMTDAGELPDEFWKPDLAMYDHYLRAVSAIPSLGSVLSSPVVRDGVVYFGSTDGYVYALQ